MFLKVMSVDNSKTINTHLNYIFQDFPEVEWVGHAYTIKEAQKLIVIHNPDVILLDIMVNEESGFDLLDFVKSNYPSTVVYMLSNVTDSFYIKKSKEMGARGFIDKSFEFYSINNILKSLYQVKFCDN
jgi:two-component system chemotaxis response regulator CheY